MNIKTHLLRLGLIRGQPRTSLNTGPSARASKLVGTPNTGLISGLAGGERGSFPFPDPQQPDYPFPSGMASIPGKERFTYLYSGLNIVFTCQSQAMLPSHRLQLHLLPWKHGYRIHMTFLLKSCVRQPRQVFLGPRMAS